ncbi:hypothetical protein BC826DRAFT_1028281 [Russula brevipes]|nr:hypothetical protein BC826DRAFT_1028281 [Russula brevipes]
MALWRNVCSDRYCLGGCKAIATAAGLEPMFVQLILKTTTRMTRNMVMVFRQAASLCLCAVHAHTVNRSRLTALELKTLQTPSTIIIQRRTPFFVVAPFHNAVVDLDVADGSGY